MAKQRDFFEPWSALQTVTKPIPHPFPFGIPEGADQEACERTIEAYHRVLAKADWQLWGSAMQESSETLALLSPGEIVAQDGKAIVATVRNNMVRPEKSVEPEEVAKRIAACVNACAGIPDPEKFIGEIRAFLLGFQDGDMRHLDYVPHLLALCVPLQPRPKHEVKEYY